MPLNSAFAFTIKSTAKQTNGLMLYQDKTACIDLLSVNLNSLSISEKTNGAFTGKGIVNKVSGYTFDVSVQDIGHHGKTDYFTIHIKDPSGKIIYTKTGPLHKGNIKIF